MLSGGRGQPGVPETQRRHAQPAGQMLGGGGRHSLVEEQQVWWVECEVTLEAMLGGQVGKTAELGRAYGVSLPCPAPSVWDHRLSPLPSTLISALFPLPTCPLCVTWTSLSSSSCLNLYIRMASERVKPRLNSTSPRPQHSGPLLTPSPIVPWRLIPMPLLPRVLVWLGLLWGGFESLVLY